MSLMYCSTLAALGLDLVEQRLVLDLHVAGDAGHGAEDAIEGYHQVGDAEHHHHHRDLHANR